VVYDGESVYVVVVVAGLGVVMAESAYEELVELGELGTESLELLRSLGRQVTRTRSFPPPPEFARWDDDAVDDLLARMLTREGAGSRFVTTCFLKAVDEESLERLFIAAIKNFLIDEAKGTERGKLRRRFARRLAEDSRFCKSGGGSPRWALASSPPSAVWHGDLNDHIGVAWSVRGVQITGWNHAGPTPAGTVQALMAVLTAVLEAAGGAVREEDLAKVLEARFDLLSPPQFTQLFANDGCDVGRELPDETDVDPVFTDVRAREIWDSLMPIERVILPYLEEGREKIAIHLGIGQEQSGAVVEALREKLRLALTEDDAQLAILHELLASSDPPAQ
jgi:hypothetical protein